MQQDVAAEFVGAERVREPRCAVGRTQIDELRRLVADGRAVLLITHDLALARRVADRIAVMYAGRLVGLALSALLLGLGLLCSGKFAAL